MREHCAPPAAAGSPPAAAQAKADKAAQAQDKGKKTAEKQASVVVLVPHVVVVQENYANGCWIRLYDDEKFRGTFVTLVGPRATVAAYDNENLTQKVMNFKPGQRVPDLDPKLGFFENIRSLRITCGK